MTHPSIPLAVRETLVHVPPQLYGERTLLELGREVVRLYPWLFPEPSGG